MRSGAAGTVGLYGLGSVRMWIALAFAAVCAVIFFDEWVQSRSAKKLRDWLNKKD